MASDVSPVLEHIIMPDLTGDNNQAEWGYQNRVNAERDVPVGNPPANYFSGAAQDQGQPTHFLNPAATPTLRAGRVQNAFKTPLPATDLVWHLYSSTATAGGRGLKPLVVSLLCSEFTLTKSDATGGAANRVAKFLVTNPNPNYIVVPRGPKNNLVIPPDKNQNLNFLLSVTFKMQLPGGLFIAPDPALLPTSFGPGARVAITIRTDYVSGDPNDDMSGVDMLGQVQWDLHGSRALSNPGLGPNGPFQLPCNPIV
jgi:hypothetical protein